MTTTDTMRTMNDPTAGGWAWVPQPEARTLVEQLLVTFLEKCPEAARFGEKMLTDAGTHITDWVGVILTPDTAEMRERLAAAGYVPRVTEFVDADIQYAFGNPAASTPDILLTESDRMSVGLLVDSVADFFAANQLDGVDHIQGEPIARARWAQVAQGEGAALWVFERHGYDGFHLKFEIAEHRIAAVHHLERFRARARGGDQANAFERAERAVRAAADELGADWAASLFMRAEREYFVRNNCGAMSQRNRQAAVGLGMANIDHAVYACSSGSRAATLDLFAELDFMKRETVSLAHGDEASVLEQPVTGDVIAIVTPAENEVPSGAGTFTRLVGESLITAGPAGIAFRGEHTTLGSSLGIPAEGDRAVASVPVSSAAIDDAAANGHIEDGIAHSLRSGDVIGPVVSLVSRGDGSRAITPAQLAWRVPGQG